MDQKIKELANFMKSSRNTVVMTGAGMDTESNIPDFRSKNGIWRKVDPTKVAHIDTLYKNYDLFREFYCSRITKLDNIKPHPGHYVLADLQDKGYIQSIATQNVSGLHAMAGSKNIYELHGNIRDIKCDYCNQPGTINQILKKKNCSNCGRKALRPEIVLFGEPLPAITWRDATEDIKNSELLIVIGTSLEVYPVNQFPYMTKGKTVYINLEDVKDYDFDLKMMGRAGEILIKLKEILL